MTIQRDGEGWFEICCDDCGIESDQIESDEFTEAVAEAKSRGWRLAKVGATWEHTCPSCARGADFR